MPTTEADGGILYQYPDVFSDILLNGISVAGKHPIALKIWPSKDNYGWVQLNVKPETGEVHQWIDGQYQNYWQYGYISLIGPATAGSGTVGPTIIA